jgi:hypothetical protein
MVHLFEFYGPFIFGCVLLLDVLRLKNYKQPIGLVGSCFFCALNKPIPACADLVEVLS